jgi:hypothetical protein
MATAQANEIDVSYTVSGSPGSWVYDFSVTNNLINSPGGESDIYLFGVELGVANVTGYPNANWGLPSFNSLNSGSYTGGQGIQYGINWIDGNFPTSLLPGQTLSGFRAASTEATARSSVRWYAFSASTGGFYAGTFCTMNCGAPFTNPGFEYGALQAAPSGVPDDLPAAPLATVLESVHPNPFNPQAAVAFTLAAAGPVRLAVYDLHGTKVHTLVDGDLAAGRHEAVWDGRDDRGQAMASGTYLARLVAGPVTQMRKMVLMK